MVNHSGQTAVAVSMTAPPPPIVRAEGLTVRYGRFTALNGMTVNIPEGCVGLLGPNGAGKSTFIKTALGMVRPASGRAEILGLDASRDGMRIRQRVGYMPEQDCTIPGLTAVQYVRYAGELAGLPTNHALRRAHEVLEYCGLGEVRYRKVETYSTGMRQRVKLAQALVHGPRLLLLDEPTNGLDPKGRIEMLSLVKDVSKMKGLSVIVCSHLLPDIERTCDHVVVLVRGHVPTSGTVQDLRRLDGSPIDVTLKSPQPAFVSAAEQRGLTYVEDRAGALRFIGQAAHEVQCQALFAAAAESGAQIRQMVPARRTLEEMFLEAVGG